MDGDLLTKLLIVLHNGPRFFRPYLFVAHLGLFMGDFNMWLDLNLSHNI